MRQLSFVDAVNEGLQEAMTLDPKVLFFGLGATDPKRMFGSATGLVERFGPERVFDMPTSENGMTGVGVGAAIQGFPVVMTHLRLDFFLLAMDQLVNSAAKWHYMFGGQDSVPLTIRLVIGRGWGQGPTHSQNLQAWFAHIPGLKVVVPSTPAAAKGLLLSSIFDPNPVVFLEHRWLHNQVGPVEEGDVRMPLERVNRLSEGSDLTIVAMSYMTIEAIHAIRLLKSVGITCDLLDLATIVPSDWSPIEASVRKTGRLMALDVGAKRFSVSSEVIAHVAGTCFSDLKAAPVLLGSPHIPQPTSPSMSEGFYPRATDIVREGLKLMGKLEAHRALVEEAAALTAGTPHDVPGDWFKGPF